jgi:hypothetical protein
VAQVVIQVTAAMVAAVMEYYLLHSRAQAAAALVAGVEHQMKRVEALVGVSVYKAKDTVVPLAQSEHMNKLVAVADLVAPTAVVAFIEHNQNQVEHMAVAAVQVAGMLPEASVASELSALSGELIDFSLHSIQQHYKYKL